MASTQSLELFGDSKPVSRAKRITQQARLIFSAYRRDDFADPDGFVLQLGMVLERYPDAVISEVSHPLTGIQRRHKGRPPDIAAIVEECDFIRDRNARIADLQRHKLVSREPRAIGFNRANVFVRADHEWYAPMVEQTRKGDPLDWRWDTSRPGIWVSLTWIEQRRTQASTVIKSWTRLTASQLEALYPAAASHGAEPRQAVT